MPSTVVMALVLLLLLPILFGEVAAATRGEATVQMLAGEQSSVSWKEVGSLVRLNCTLENSTGSPVNISWMFNGLQLPMHERHQLQDNNQLLLILDFNDEDEGDYECIVEGDEACDDTGDDFGTCQRVYRASLRLKNETLRFSQVPANQTVPLGSDALFVCRATAGGASKPRVRFAIQNGSQIVHIVESAKYLVLPNLLIVKNVTPEDCGLKYFCLADSDRMAPIQVEFGLEIFDDVTSTKKPEMTTSTAPKLTKPTTKDNFDSLVRSAIDRARAKVDRAIERTLGKLKDPVNRKSPSDILTLFRLPKETAIELTKSREIYETAYREIAGLIRAGKIPVPTGSNSTDFPNYELDPQLLALIAQLTGCQTHARDNSQCATRMCFHLRYRSFDGTCNNLDNPWYGASNTPLKRLLAPIYENGMDDPVGWQLNRTYGGFPKPSARLVSQRLLRAVEPLVDSRVSAMTMQWGQFLDHDLDFTPVDPADSTFLDGRRCNETCTNEAPCFPIPVYSDDTRIRHRPCIGFVRSSATCGSGASSLFVGSRPYFREQLNQITAYIDASNVYGSTENEARDVRELDSDRGFLREGLPTSLSNRRLLPFSTSQPVDCQIDPRKRHIPCFLAGDHRANEQLGLTAVHTLWMREHNRLARGLRSLNPHWSGDQIFFEARKIVGAMHQHLTFSHWLPVILGQAGMRQLGRYRGYNMSVDASIANVFATAAMRFGHTLINPVLHRLNASYKEIAEGSLRLHQAFFAPHRLVGEGGIDPILRGLVGRGAKQVEPTQPINTELTERLFQLAHEVALDLAALNIQRGRDHGLPGYNDWRSFCGRHRAESFDDMRWSIRDPRLRERIRLVYGHPNNVDLFAGLVAEDAVDGSLVGPTTLCLLVDQMRRLRDGDRFWYESPDQFSHLQLAQIRRTSLARVICDNADNVTAIQPDVFHLPGPGNPRLDCSRLDPGLNLEFWKECPAIDGQQCLTSSRMKREAESDDRVRLRSQVDELARQVENLSRQLQSFEGSG
ncbi:hypothetical protein BOX15_Mlig021508g1 [Macrostomum lignano]|uniref:Uncharacterized protein n=2 Tax=Macrostomum lignano TaxID=282301 RepID=A0A267F5Z7_9PLAT|nr:hypothetical protein BOX15_Mlig021508g1 [Macrostomum lignano]